MSREIAAAVLLAVMVTAAVIAFRSPELAVVTGTAGTAAILRHRHRRRTRKHTQTGERHHDH